MAATFEGSVEVFVDYLHGCLFTDEASFIKARSHNYSVDRRSRGQTFSITSEEEEEKKEDFGANSFEDNSLRSSSLQE